ncbi:hypothetical protein SAMN04488065_1024 [Haloplanus vescus]|uniref:DUF7575 domain-containing protein n=1 Tax=Haloplanus vescus TaxID=555874 RepID=A0A1H3WP14_9EURY|nr:hypothetical protein [Haloplanus vescus]SDZ88876.1 hypothetical protein SAMN04488065_1024 [Haloplanus vescus]
MTNRRVVVAVFVSLVGAVFGIAGVGHAYLRRWKRAVAWFSLVLGAGLVLVTSFANPATATVSTLPLRVTVPVGVLLALNTVDAHRVARGMDTPEGESCPSCGRTLDSELEFCPWCAGSPEGERREDDG